MNFFREKLRRLGPVREIERVASGQPETVTLLREGSRSNPVAAAISLARRHLPLREAKDAAERAFDGAPAAVTLLVEDLSLLERELAAAGFRIETGVERARQLQAVYELARMDEVDVQPFSLDHYELQRDPDETDEEFAFRRSLFEENSTHGRKI